MRKKIQISTLFQFKMIAAAALVSLLSLTYVQAQEVKGQTVVSSVTQTATVTYINQKTREVTIKTDDGKEYSFVASSAVKNLYQVKKGDLIKATYTEALAYQVRKHGTPGVVTTQAAMSADSGATPGAVVAQQTTVTVTITAIDPNVPTVTFKGPKGNTETVKVRDPKNLVGVKVGDKVDITYTESLAITVDEAPKK
jgi:hypothetical protein